MSLINLEVENYLFLPEYGFDTLPLDTLHNTD